LEEEGAAEDEGFVSAAAVVAVPSEESRLRRELRPLLLSALRFGRAGVLSFSAAAGTGVSTSKGLRGGGVGAGVV